MLFSITLGCNGPGSRFLAPATHSPYTSFAGLNDLRQTGLLSLLSHKTQSISATFEIYRPQRNLIFYTALSWTFRIRISNLNFSLALCWDIANSH
ncbi:hypothetical protein NPIL_232081 [Nephila pilipes]|uniref:Uncharacterized protein n=1 Tax=Nephila pilipes TaxID=299642 RepID=A0A8X6UBD3_NEPPI|nr:hypothetical protein NPIL_232081 [Nephila pilipes]